VLVSPGLDSRVLIFPRTVRLARVTAWLLLALGGGSQSDRAGVDEKAMMAFRRFAGACVTRSSL